MLIACEKCLVPTSCLCRSAKSEAAAWPNCSRCLNNYKRKPGYAMVMVPCVRSQRGSHLPPSFGISALTLLIAFCPLIFAGLSPCAPSVECRANILDWSVRHGPGFISRSLGLKRLTVELDAILPCTQPANGDAVPVVLVDVGAGIHGLQPCIASRRR